MSYAAQQDIIDLYGERELQNVADRDADGGVDDNVVARALENVSAEMDAYIGARYAVPLASPTTVLKGLCVDIALYRMALKSGPRTEEHRTRYEDAIKMLKGIADGKIGIGAPQAGDEDEAAPEEFGSGFYTLSRG